LLRAGFATIHYSIQLLGILMVLLAVGGMAPWAFQWTEFQQTTYFVTASVVAMIWGIVRLRKTGTHPKNTYGPLVRWLHWLALEPAAVRNIAYDLERQFFLPKRESIEVSTSNNHNPADGAVYVCGLARSGTTTLLRILDEIDDFRSLTYRDMPFVLAPNLWKQITKFSPSQAATVERAHGDGIQVGFDSPEGFEEVFWRTFGTSHFNEKCLSAVTPSAEVLAAFADYRAIVANPRTEPQLPNGKPRRYLSKNNNNLLRLHSLCADPTATVLLAYRDPVDTARSLHRQHQRFCDAQSSDHFTRSYMLWLVHHEFGLDHRPFCFALSEMDSSLTPADPNYWLAYWNAVYLYVLAQESLNFRLVNHDDFCGQPGRVLRQIFSILAVEANPTTLAMRIKFAGASKAKIDGFREDLLQRVETTYRALKVSPKNISHAYNA
jgi:hypothetical protein